MKTTHILILAAFLLGIAACSKQENTEAASQTPKAETPAMEKPMDTQLTALLPNEISTDDTTTIIEQDDSGRKVIYWEDPMVPDRRFSKSGQSPFMDMKLAPRYAE